MKIRLFLVLLLAAAILAASALADTSEIKFERDKRIKGRVIDIGPDYLTFLILEVPMFPYTLTLESIVNLKYFNLPLFVAMEEQREIILQTSIVILPSGKRERRITSMRFVRD